MANLNEKIAALTKNPGPVKIACIGEAMVELSFTGDGLQQPAIGFAGDSLNTAIYLKREMGDGAEVSYITALGEDEFSSRMTAFMRREGLKTDKITRDKQKLPGLYAISTDDQGERTFNYWRENSAARKLFQTSNGFDFSCLGGFDIIYYSAISLAILPPDVRGAFLDWLDDARNRGKLLAVFDSNFRPALWSDQKQAQLWVERAWRVCDIALPSADDEKALFNDISLHQTIKRLNSCGAIFGAIKRGADGPLPLTPIDVLPDFDPATKIVDTTAAGDSFNGAFLAAILSGSDMGEALSKGHNCARKTVGFAGAFDKHP